MQSPYTETVCKICSGHTNLIFKTPVLNKHDVAYYKCGACGFIQTEEPYWLEEAYNSAITSLDIGLAGRNIEFSGIVEDILKKHFNTSSQFIDYGGGYGLFVRLMRDKGFDFYRQDYFCENIFAKHFDISDIHREQKFELLTAFEVFEHLTDPLAEIKKMFSYSDSILFSTILQPSENFTSPDQWWYFIPETGQHISLYSLTSLEIIAQKNNCFLYTNKHNLHLFCPKKLNTNPLITDSRKSITSRLLNKLSAVLIPEKRENALPGLLDKDFNFIRKKLNP